MGIEKKKNLVMDALKSKKSLIAKMSQNYKSKEKEFLSAIKQRECFKDEEWYWFETRNWLLTDKWAKDALDNFNEYAWEEATAHDQGFLTWYETAINDVNNFWWEVERWITTEDLKYLIDKNLHFKSILQFQLELESWWESELDLTGTPVNMFIRWDNNSIEFWKEDDNEPSYRYDNTFKSEYDTFNAVYKIIDTISEVDEKWAKECMECWDEKEYRMFDMDWTNLVELLVCNWCGYWKPTIPQN